MILAQAIELLGPGVLGSRVAYDLCSGDGAFTRYLATIFNRVVAVEINPDLLLDSNYGRGNILRLTGDINNLPDFLNNHPELAGEPSFVLMNWAVCHMNNPAQVAQSLYQRASDDCVLFIKDNFDPPNMLRANEPLHGHVRQKEAIALPFQQAGWQILVDHPIERWEDCCVFVLLKNPGHGLERPRRIPRG